MAEGFGEDFLAIVHVTSLAYLGLRDAYQALPIPLVLPMEYDASEGIEEFHRVMIEAADRIFDLPVDEVAGQILFESTYHWISATAAMRMYATTRIPSYSDIAKWNLTKATDGAIISETMLRQQD